MSTSKLQRYVSQQLSIHFGQYIIRENTRPDWLTAPDGARLELDFLIEELNIAIEVQGCQHWQFIEFFHTNTDGYNLSVLRDKTKKEICDFHNIRLIEVFSRQDIRNIIRSYSAPKISDTEAEYLRWEVVGKLQEKKQSYKCQAKEKSKRLGARTAKRRLLLLKKRLQEGNRTYNNLAKRMSKVEEILGRINTLRYALAVMKG